MIDLNTLMNNPEVEKIEIPTAILEHINKKFELREYQEKAIKRFIYYYNNKDFYQKDIQTDLLNINKNHLLFNMATGSGKTLLMASLILYLQEQGYNDFIFLSHLTSINVKTEDNFFSKTSNKYLFNVDKQNNIKIDIKSYQGLASEMTATKENGFSLEDIKNKKLVIVADESHHLNAGQDKDSGMWEYCVNKILNANSENWLLEFTATINWNKLKSKYLSKCLIKYDLRDFYKSGYTKSISLLQRMVSNENLMLGGIVLNKYRQVLFSDLNQNIKPVILFKNKSISESIENHKKFNELVESLDTLKLTEFYNTLQDKTITKTAFDYIKTKYTSLSEIIKNDFKDLFVINTNATKEIENNAKLLNTLEEQSNYKRVIFSVDKLNEGWDVLNLFDIVKLYETQSISETTQEAQLLGRGARYCPFDYENKERNKRKFEEVENYGILEQLYFHSAQDNIAISKLKKELQNMGITITENEKIEIKLKDKIKEQIKNKLVFYNSKIQKYINRQDFFEDIKKYANTLTYNVNNNKEISVNLMDYNEIVNKNFDNLRDKHCVKFAIFENYIKENAFYNSENYNFNSLYKRIGINSFADFIKQLDDCSIKVTNFDNNNISHQYAIYEKFINDIYNKVISKQLREYEGSREFEHTNFNKKFRGKIIKIKTRENKQYNFDWYVYDNADLTSEEISFVEFFNDVYSELAKKFSNIYLVRNERDLKLYQFKNGTGFEPDFILFMTKNGLEYQILIEPKGEHLWQYDNDKNDFLKQVKDLSKIKKGSSESIREFDCAKYKLVGMPFYNSTDEKCNEFKDNFNKEFLC